jgi:hypothetical protein
VKNDCGLDVSYVSDVSVYKNEPVSVDENDATPIVSMIHPNPASSDVRVVFGSDVRVTAIEIFDAAGAQVAVYAFDGAPRASAHVDVATLANGVYSLKVISGSKHTAHRLVIAR